MRWRRFGVMYSTDNRLRKTPMKLSTTLMTAVATLAMVAVGSVASAQTHEENVCEVNAVANARVIAQVISAPTEGESMRILTDAMLENYENATCLMQLYLQTRVQPEAGPEEVVTPVDPIIDTIPEPAENSSQLNEGNTSGSASPVVPDMVKEFAPENL